LVLPESDGSFRAEILEFPGCLALGDTPADALSNLEEVAASWIEAALAQGQRIPEPMENAGFSGKLVVRLPRSLHRKAAQTAEREGVSLNQFILSSIAEQVGHVQARSKGGQLQPVPSAQPPADFYVQIGLFPMPQLPSGYFGGVMFGGGMSHQLVTSFKGNEATGLPIRQWEQPNA
jgi:predicted RNase H-like HicB family nuclease